MKRGILFVSLFLISILFISGCVQFSQIRSNAKNDDLSDEELSLKIPRGFDEKGCAQNVPPYVYVHHRTLF